MLLLCAALALVPVSYTFPLGAKLGYDVDVAFDGFLPVLGGFDGQAGAKLGLQVSGLPADTNGNPRVWSELKAFSLTMNGETLPFSVENVVAYFPKNTVSMTPQGKVLKSDAPNIQLPVRLPGLDVKRFPDITFLPVEFPAAGVEADGTWTFSKPFGDSTVSYSVKAKAVTDAQIQMEVTLAQSFDTLEDEAKNLVTNPKEAVVKVHTDMTGSGTVVFDRKLGIVTASTVAADSVSRATDLKTKKATDRKLKMTVKVSLRDKKSPPWK